MSMDNLSVRTETVGKAVLNAAYSVHSEMGPGLLESVYQECLQFALNEAGYKAYREVPIPIKFRGNELEAGFRADLVVDDLVLVELKAVESLLPIHKAQAITYLKLSSIQLGFLINFNEVHLKNGMRRIVRPDLLPPID